MNVTYDYKDGTVYELNVDNLPATSIAYLLQYGFDQSMQDSIAGTAKAVKAEREKAGDSAVDVELAVMAAIEGKLLKRMDSIKNGTMGVRTRDAVLSLAKDIVTKNAAPKKLSAEVLNARAADYVSRHREWLVAELDRRKNLADVAPPEEVADELELDAA